MENNIILRKQVKSNQLIKEDKIIDDRKSSDFFNSTLATFKKACRAAGESIDLYYNIADLTVCLRFAGPELVPFLTPSLEHLRIAPLATPDLTINVWDSVSTKTKMSPPPWSSEDYTVQGDIEGFNNERFGTNVSMISCALSVVDLQNNEALWWIRDSEDFPIFESSCPFQTILNWWTKKQNLFMIHSGAVGTSNSGVLLTGRSRSGKSTASIACIDSHLFFASDDLCLLKTDPIPYIYSLYSSGRLDPFSIEKLSLEKLISEEMPNNSDEKSIIFFHNHFPEKIVSGFPLKAIILPKVSGEINTNIRTAKPSEAIKVLGPNTVLQFTRSGAESFKAVTKLVTKLPCYFMDTGTDVSEVPTTIMRVLSENTLLD